MELTTSRVIRCTVHVAMAESGEVTGKVVAHAEYHPAQVDKDDASKVVVPAMVTSTEVSLDELADSADLKETLQDVLQGALKTSLPILTRRIERAVSLSQRIGTDRGEIPR